MIRRIFLASTVLAIGFGLMAAGNLRAQEKTGTVSGIVQSANGKPLAEARVYLQPSDGHAPHTAQTDAAGHYSFANVKPGLYDLRAQFGGAWTELQRNINVHANEEVTVNLKLQPPATPPAKPANNNH